MTIRSLVLAPAQRKQLHDEARAAGSFECCGLIEGFLEGDAAFAVVLHPATNLSSEPDRFEIDPAEHFALLRRLREGSNHVIGCYHSHPAGEAIPSPHDLASAGEDGFLWLIAALNGARFDLAVFEYRGGQFAKLQLNNERE